MQHLLGEEFCDYMSSGKPVIGGGNVHRMFHQLSQEALDYREFCLSLGEDIEEKLPFQKFKNGEGVLVFYVMGHMFSFFDCNDFSVISLKCQPERIEDLKAQYECIGNPYNESPKHWIGINPKFAPDKHWIGINPTTAPDDLLKELTRNSYKVVKAKYTKK